MNAHVRRNAHGHRTRRGLTAVAVILALVIVNLVIVALVLQGARDHDLTVRRVESIQAYYAAESGLNMAIREVITDLDEDGDCLMGSVSHDGNDGNDPGFGAGQFMATASINGNEVTLQSYGRAGTARRQIATVIVLTGPAVISYDDESSDVSSTSSLAFNHTIGGEADRLLVVGVSSEAGSGNYDIDSVSYNSVPMTPAVANSVGSSLYANAEIWYMLEAALPAAGTYQVSITTTGADEVHGGAISVYGAAQQAPEATAVNDDGEAGWDAISTPITTLTDNAWVFEAVCSGNVIGWDPASGQDERYDETAGSSSGAGCSFEVPTNGPVTQDWDGNGSNRMTHVLAAFAPK